MSRSLSRPLVGLLLVLSLLSLPAEPGGAQLPIDAGVEGPPPGAGSAPAGTVVFPTDELTVPDPAQATGRRIALPLPDCAVQVSRCDEVRLLNALDGFDLLPRIAVQLQAAPEGPLEEVFTPDVLGVRPVGGELVGVTRLVYDPDDGVLYGEPAAQLVEGTPHEVVYQGVATRFTTLTASAGLAQMRRQLDDGSAYDAAGIPADQRGLSFTQGEVRTVFPAAEVASITRLNQTVPGGDLVAERVIDTAVGGAGTVAFGSFRAPSWLDGDVTIEAAPTGGRGPAVRGADTVGVTLILPRGSAPDGGWPVAVFGPGITRSKYDLFLAADLNASRGLATMSFDPVGHAFGPGSEVAVQLVSSPDPVRFSAFGRGSDRNDDGVITNQEGVQATAAPSPVSPVGLRDGLRQTAADLMALVRAIGRGVDVDGDGVEDLARDGVSIYAQSLGGIYSTMLMGVDPAVEVAVLNVPGGAILDIARVSPVFREIVGDALRDRVPGLLNGGVNGFTEDLGLVGVDGPVSDPAAGATDIQQVLYDTNWINRPGSPEAFAPLLRTSPLPDSRPKEVLYQFAFGDRVVPNPASARLARALGDDSRVAFYRNDRTATRDRDPHGFLLDPTVQGRNQAQAQALEFLLSDGQTILDPDGPLPTWEVPIADPDLLRQRNFDEALYAAPAAAPRREVGRLSGPGRAATAVAVSTEVFDQADSVVLARGDVYADALAGAPLAATLGAPLLLSDRDGLPAEVAAEVERLGAETAVLLGGPAALSDQVADELTAMGVEVDRIAGPDRFSTAALVAERIGYTSEVLLVEGGNADPGRGWPDALSAAGIAAGLGLPILLTNAEELPQATADALVATRDVTVVGGPAAVGEGVVAAVAALAGDVSRVFGADRYATSAAAAEDAVRRGLQPTAVWIATGGSFADGLAAGAAAGATGGVVLLAPTATLQEAPAVGSWLQARGASVDVARLLGGTSALSETTAAEVGAALRAG